MENAGAAFYDHTSSLKFLLPTGSVSITYVKPLTKKAAFAPES